MKWEKTLPDALIAVGRYRVCQAIIWQRSEGLYDGISGIHCRPAMMKRFCEASLAAIKRRITQHLKELRGRP